MSPENYERLYFEGELFIAPAIVHSPCNVRARPPDSGEDQGSWARTRALEDRGNTKSYTIFLDDRYQRMSS